MDYIYNEIFIEEKTAQDNQKRRLLMYYRKCKELMFEKKKHDERFGKKQFMNIFWNKESKWEQKIYGKLNEWERRHPIMGIVFCTVLGGILVSLIAGILLEAVLMYI